MTPQEFKQARRELGLTVAALARILDIGDRTIRKWEAPENTNSARAPNPVACRVMRWMLDGRRPEEWPDRPKT